MADRHVLPFGSWPSPISIEMAVAGNLTLREPRLSGGYVYWTEGRPQEKGCQIIVRWSERDGAVDVTPAGYNARTMAHEYGGGWYAVDGETVFFSNVEDGRLYRQGPDTSPVAITEAGPFRYGDLVVDRAHARLLCVREDMSAEPEPKDELISIDLESGAVEVLASGYDFYNTPRPTGDGRRLAWLSWRHPNMPWDSTELWVAELDESGAVASTQMIAGGGEEAVVQPEWAPDGSLVFVSDRSGWWNLYRWRDGDTTALAPSEAEFAGSLWVFGLSWYGVADDGTIVAAASRQGHDELWMIPATGGPPERIDVPDALIDSLQLSGRRICYLAGGPSAPPSLVLLDLDSGERRVLRQSYELTVDRDYISVPQPITFPTTDGDVAHALYYPPTSLTHAGPAGERPPLIVTIHGGPTSSVSSGLNLGKQVFTSRGFGVVDVNYRGSTGYGRDYMRRLDGKWGVYDVDDCVAAARFLAERGDVDERRMAIRGGSAGGYTTLCALAFHDAFAAGASHFGVADLEALARDTHKFESRYTDRLVAPYPDRIDIYRERSPIYQMDRITSPLIVLQGRDDKVVPIAQAEQIVEALRKSRTPHAYLVFDGEGHGFRQAANIRRALEAELSFYAQVFGFELADSVEPIEVEYLA